MNLQCHGIPETTIPIHRVFAKLNGSLVPENVTDVLDKPEGLKSFLNDKNLTSIRHPDITKDPMSKPILDRVRSNSTKPTRTKRTGTKRSSRNPKKRSSTTVLHNTTTATSTTGLFTTLVESTQNA